jgi:indolepyruvate ferredoxin oxidoreductase
MTGGQEIGGNWDVEGIVKQVRAEGVKKVSILSQDPKKYNHLLEEGIKSLHRDSIVQEQEELSKYEGVSVLIFDQTCAAEKRRRRKRGLMEDPKKRVVINKEVCEGCGDCSIQSSCVSIEPLETELGRKRKINQSNCNKDYSCIKGFCPSFVTVDAEIKKNTDFKDLGEFPEPKLLVDSEVANIMLTGIGGTGVLTISAILAYAAHYEGKDSSVLDMTGLAQKGGAVWSHIKIYEHGVAPFSQKISPGAADILLACDGVVGTKPEIQEVVSKEKTLTVLNSNTIPVADFVTNRDLDFKNNDVLKMLENTTKDIVSFVPAIKISEELSGDAIGTNMLMLGSAYQNGLIPIKAENIIKAIELNGVGIERNVYNFNLGRLYTINPNHEVFKFLNKDAVKSLNSVELFEDRLERITKYDKKVVADFIHSKELIDQILAQEIETESIAKDAIQELYRVFAIKDEYEVARMHIENTEKILDENFSAWNNLKFYLSPPMISFIKDKRTGRPIKIAIPAYVAMPIFKILTSLSFLRGTIFNPLGLTADRKQDIEHKELFKKKLKEIDSLIAGQKSKKLIDLVDASRDVKGYGPVREKSYLNFRKKINAPKQKRARIISRLFSFKSNRNIKAKKVTSNQEKNLND